MVNFRVKIPLYGDSYKLGEIDFVEDESIEAVCGNIGILNIFSCFSFCILLMIYPYKTIKFSVIEVYYIYSTELRNT